MKAICIKEPGKALLKLLYGGICGSDPGAYRDVNAYVFYPRVPDHAFSAEIIEMDNNGKGLKPGMIVTNTYKWTDAPKAFEEFSANAGKTLKVVLDFT